MSVVPEWSLGAPAAAEDALNHAAVVGLILLAFGLLAVLIVVILEPAKNRLRIDLPWDPVLSPLVRFKPRAMPLVAAAVWSLISFALIAPFVFGTEDTQRAMVLPFVTFCVAVPASLASYLWCMASFVRLLGFRHVKPLLAQPGAVTSGVERLRRHAPSLLLILVAAGLAASITYADKRAVSCSWVLLSLTRATNSFLGISLLCSILWMLWRVMLRHEPRDRRRLAYGALFLRSDRLKRFYASIVAMTLSTTCVMTPYATAALLPDVAGAMLMPRHTRVLWTGLVLLMAIGGILLIVCLESRFAVALRHHARQGTIASVARRLEVRDRMLGGGVAMSVRIVLAGALGVALQIVNLWGAVSDNLKDTGAAPPAPPGAGAASGDGNGGR